MISPPPKMVSYNPDYVVQLINSLTPDNFETARHAVQARILAEARPDMPLSGHGTAAQPPPVLHASAATSQEEEEHEGEVPCECEPNIWKACPHECSLCLKVLTLKDSEGVCWMCEEDLITVEKDWPEDAAEAKKKSIFTEGAYHALILRIRANNCREAANDTDDAEEVRKCLEEAKYLDARASFLLFHKADSRFKPWWFASWDYWMLPGTTAQAPDWAAPVAHLLSPEVLAAPSSVVSPCGISGHVMPIGTLFCPTCWP